MIASITFGDLKAMFLGASKNLEVNKNLVDSLNVFPVPDGDTGTNMNLTMASTVKELQSVSECSAECVCNALTKGALKGARGNSGVILSQIFKGFAGKLKDSHNITTKEFALAIKNGANTAYDVVTNPKEGTILTVARLMGDYAVKIASKKPDFLDFLQLILKRGEEILADTPNMLPVLKKAGVVDAGGKGFLVIIYGMYNSLAGIEVSVAEATESADLSANIAFLPDVHNLEDIEFAYCTEFFVVNLKKITTMSDIDKFRDRLAKMGDSVVVAGDLSLVKVHVHTNSPDKAMGYALQLGELDNVKIENMLEQNREFKKEIESKTQAPKKESAMVAICLGSGIKEIFTQLGVDVVLEGGQTMNPST
ncbi:MAG: DAK2 domain-containing protein, partial [Firmicutes bacterium]|nr:DAK2 domain-containing protein [Bacillota bacterium]